MVAETKYLPPELRSSLGGNRPKFAATRRKDGMFVIAGLKPEDSPAYRSRLINGMVEGIMQKARADYSDRIAEFLGELPRLLEPFNEISGAEKNVIVDEVRRQLASPATSS